jgi:hypothetical protein
MPLIVNVRADMGGGGEAEKVLCMGFREGLDIVVVETGG